MREVNKSGWTPSLVGVVALLLFVLVTALGAYSGAWKVVAIGTVAFVAMVGGTALGARADETNPYGLVWGYGLAAGAMIASAALFLVPQAMGIGGEAGAPQIGGIGIAAGILIGYAAHTVGHRLTHVDVSFDVTTAEIAAHSLGAGLVIGAVYGSLPELGLLLGLSIVSHKGPAGYAAARRLRRNDKAVSSLLLPAGGVAITAIPVAVFSPPFGPTGNAVMFGFAAGIFLHIAMDFLPNCEAGSEIDEVIGAGAGSHGLLDELRSHAVVSTSLGGIAVVVAWLLI